MSAKLTDQQLRDAHVRMEGQEDTRRSILNKIISSTYRCPHCRALAYRLWKVWGLTYWLCDNCGKRSSIK